MTKDSVIDIVHKTIYGFFDIVEDDSEEPISEKDKLLLEVNKAVCNAIKDMPDDERKANWIPVTERLPEVGEKCLLTIHEIGWNCKEYTRVIIGEYNDNSANYILAWMPLPKPYEE